MNIPNFENVQLVDKDGFLTSQWSAIFSQLFQQLQGGLSDAISVPQVTTTEMTTLSTAKSVGSIIYNKDTNKFMACVPSGSVGIFKEINLL